MMKIAANDTAIIAVVNARYGLCIFVKVIVKVAFCLFVLKEFFPVGCLFVTI